MINHLVIEQYHTIYGSSSGIGPMSRIPIPHVIVGATINQSMGYACLRIDSDGTTNPIFGVNIRLVLHICGMYYHGPNYPIIWVDAT